MKSLYNWTLSWATHLYAKLALFFISLAEASFFPIPPDPLLIIMTVLNPKNWLKLALITTIGSIIGAAFGYLIGIVFYESVGKTIIYFYGLEKAFLSLGDNFQSHSFLAVFISAFSPIPFKVFTIASGFFQIKFFIFILASFAGRAGRFFAVAATTGYFGEKGRYFIEKYFNVLALLFAVLLIAGFFAIKIAYF